MNFEVAPKETEIKSNWYDANLYCMFLEVDGKNDWRLPTIEELHEIYQSKNNFTTDYYYWSSTDDDSDGAWVQRYNSINYECFDDKDYIGFYVRAVRSLS